MQSLESIRRSVTDGVAAWLSRLVEDLPDIAPERTDAETEEPAVAGWLHRFVREVVTVNPATRGDLTNIQIFLIESALDCVDWSAPGSRPEVPTTGLVARSAHLATIATERGCPRDLESGIRFLESAITLRRRQRRPSIGDER